MSDVAIKIENLSKQYRIGGQQQRYSTLRETLVSNAKRIISHRLSKSVNNKFWALKDVTFQVKHGEVVGIIGRNGAGKSTLLKILAHITEPTKGRVSLRGRVGSLLEVGTGFHAELTGRDNIYLNGAILGMKRAEIDRKFDEIVAFAEIEKFLDTPVKRYSSGMYVRLAFAVAAHLEPEILIVDEVLAVGDTQFQKKCLGKMSDVSKEGRTVLFVSHNMNAMSQLCNTAILLSKGEIVESGDVHLVVSHYLSNDILTSGDISLIGEANHNGSGEAYISHLAIKNGNNQLSTSFVIGDDIVFEISIEVKKQIGTLLMSIDITTSEGIPVYHLRDVDSGFNLENPSQNPKVSVTLKNQKLYPGEYLISLWLGGINTTRIDYVHNCGRFTVIDGGPLLKRQLIRQLGIVYEVAEWSRLQ